MNILTLLESQERGHVLNAALKAKQTLSPQALNALQNWQSNSWTSGALSKSYEENGELFQEIYTACEPVREVIKTMFGNTVPLMRGSHYQDRAKAPEQARLFSWTFDEKTAKGFARIRNLPTWLDNAEIQELVDKYNRTGFVQYRGYKLIRNKEMPEYFNIWRRGEMITDGDDIDDFIRSNEIDRKESADEKTQKGAVQTKDIPVKDILWITNDLGSQEVIVINHHW